MVHNREELMDKMWTGVEVAVLGYGRGAGGAGGNNKGSRVSCDASGRKQKLSL